MHMYVHNTIYNIQDMETAYISSTDEWITMWYTYIMQLFTIKKNEIMLFAATWMQLEIILLSNQSKSERKLQYHMISLICET